MPILRLVTVAELPGLKFSDRKKPTTTEFGNHHATNDVLTNKSRGHCRESTSRRIRLLKLTQKRVDPAKHGPYFWVSEACVVNEGALALSANGEHLLEPGRPVHPSELQKRKPSTSERRTSFPIDLVTEPCIDT